MKKPILGALLALLTLTWCAGAEESRQLVGRVLDIDGNVLMTNRMTESSWYQAYMEMNTLLKERLKTDENTTATIQFTVGGRSVISPGTEIEIDTIGSTRVLNVKSGTVWAKFDKQDEEFQIKTSGGVMGIEGTEFFVEADEQGDTTLTVVEGRVRVLSGDQEKLVTDGEEANFKRGAMKFARFAEMKGLTPRERRQLAFKKLGLENKPFARYILTRGLSKKKKRRLLNRLFFKHAAMRRPPHMTNTRKPPGRRPRPPLKPRNKPKFEVRSVDQSSGPLSATWTPGPTQSYALIISTDKSGEEAVWHGKSSSASFQYPNYGPALQSGEQYYLSVTPLRPDDKPFQNREGENISAQLAFNSTGHEPTYSEFTGVEVTNESGRPKIDWPAQKSAGGYMVKVFADDEVVWTDESGESSYTVPLTARALEPGKYQVVVESFDESGFKMSESSSVEFQTDGWEAEGIEGPPRE